MKAYVLFNGVQFLAIHQVETDIDLVDRYELVNKLSEAKIFDDQECAQAFLDVHKGYATFKDMKVRALKFAQ
jgi:hypothetical protein